MSIVIDQSDVLIIVPAFNEAASIGDVINELKLHSYDILVVSDGSTDATARIARENGARVLVMFIIIEEQNRTESMFM